ncbi:hypothetical protein KEJ36_00950 [Candidatus Bathyarchaeota archaeon]|nr:hypothetical protein [Candidatus Bathyarchaeota archaeon]MBS7627392.1 hypothetical protein [Candidatus Bathyarchaeota archaeon]
MPLYGLSFLAQDLLKLSSKKGGPIGWMKACLSTVGSRFVRGDGGLRSFVEPVVKLAQKVRSPEEILKLTLSFQTLKACKRR